MSDPAASVLIISGEGPDSDPWHHLPSTSAAIAQVLAPLGASRVRGSRSVSAQDLDGARLVVVNVSGEKDGETDVDAVSLIDGANRAGVAVLAVHSAALGFLGDDRWAELIGGRWTLGTSFHPQIGQALVQVDAAHPVLHGASDFLVYDERYSALEIREGNRRLAFHTEDGVVHDLAWTRERPSRGRAAYWGLGHGVESFDSAAHRERFAGVANWLLHGAAAA
jgi:type 1 glutamine amidotransferase